MHGAFASVIDESWGSLGERRFLLLMLIGFVGAFGFIRLSTRLMRSPRVPWWPGSVVSESGVHMHHLFFGIVLMMAAGGLSFAAGETDGPWYALYALLFGVGFGLAIDEYALWLHLDDVYWSREGRSSIDAALVALALIGFVLLAFVPTRIGDDSFGSLAITVTLATLHFGFVLIAAAKHRLVHALFGIFVPFSAPVRRAAPRQAAIDLGEALLRRAPPGQAGTRRAPVPVRAPHPSEQGAPARRDRRGHGGGVPGAARRGRGKLHDRPRRTEVTVRTTRRRSGAAGPGGRNQGVRTRGGARRRRRLRAKRPGSHERSARRRARWASGSRARPRTRRGS